MVSAYRNVPAEHPRPASDERGRTNEDIVEPLLPGARQVDRIADGRDRDSAWPENGILGPQLGPDGHDWIW